MYADRENGFSFPASWAEVLPPGTAEAAERLAETIYTFPPKTPDGTQTAGRTGTSGMAGGHSAAGNGAQTPPAERPAVFPPREQVFRALELTPPSSVRAVILGQDPYPTAGHASGLCFSVNPDVKPLPPSLRNIFKEYAACFDYPTPSCGDLTVWAERGVLLLNAVLTVEEGRPGSHRRRGWEAVTDAVLRACLRQPGPTVFLLWGRDAQAVFDRAAEGGTGEGNHVLRSSHPSPLGAGKPCGDSPPFLGSRPFLRSNLLLGDCAIDWRLL